MGAVAQAIAAATSPRERAWRIQAWSLAVPNQRSAHKERTLARENRRAARGKGARKRRKLSGHSRALPAAQAGVRRRVETREQGDRSHAQARGANRAYRSGPPRSGHAPCGSVSSASPNRQHSKRGHACAAQSTTADTSSSGKDRKRVASDKKCASRSRRPQQTCPVNKENGDVLSLRRLHFPQFPN